MARDLKLMTKAQRHQLELNGMVHCRSSVLKQLSMIAGTGSVLSELKAIMEKMPDAETKTQFKQVLDSDSVEELHKFAGGLDVFSKEEIWPPEKYPKLYVEKTK